MRSLYLAWNAPDGRAWYPIGRLDADHDQYVFRYTKGMLDAQRDQGLPALPAFPDLHRVYESCELFPLFQNRVLNRKRRGFADYLASLGLSEPDPIAILAITGGERETDRLEVFPKTERQRGGHFTCRFFVRGLRTLPESSMARAPALTENQRLEVYESTQPEQGRAIELRAEHRCIGWAPRYVFELLSIASGRAAIEARVLRINREETVPPTRRVLVELTGSIPEEDEPKVLSVQCTDAMISVPNAFDASRQSCPVLQNVVTSGSSCGSRRRRRPC